MPESDYDLPISVPLGPWREQAACADLVRRGLAKTSWWYPGKSENRLAEKAKAVCARCPVIDDCKGYAVATSEKHGIWGGLNEERRRTPTGQVNVRLLVCRICGRTFEHRGAGKPASCSPECKLAHKKRTERERLRGVA